MTEEVILVDEQDNAIGTMQKMEAHELGKLHRAFSVFVFNSRGELLLQQRAFDKYHSGGKWTNTCCSHPRSGEDTIDAANRRLMEEMGLTASLEHVFSFMYHAPVNERLSENEFDHVFFGVSDAQPEPDADEVADYRYVVMDELANDLADHPERYTEWLKICFNRVTDHYRKYF